MSAPSPARNVLTHDSSEYYDAQMEFDENQTIRRLIWLYVILWLIEGGLRRWFLPGLATPLLLVRDPLVLVIYVLAWSKNIFPMNGFIVGAAVLGIATLGNAIALGHGNVVVAIYGMRCDFLHVPLIFVMGRVLRRTDLIVLAKAAIWLVIPYTVLIVAQFYEPQSAWVNRGVGGNLDGAGFAGAEGHFRPPGTFSFITGTAQLYTLFTACWFIMLLDRKLPPWLMMISGVGILLAVPLSVSRTLCLSVVIVAVIGLGALIFGGRLSIQTVIQSALAAVIIPLLAFQLPVFQDGMAAFGRRWEVSTTDSGGVQGAIFERVIGDLFGSFDEVGFSGLGTGFSTTIGQQLLTSHAGIGASEAEWGRLLFDNGMVLGGMLVIYRVALAGSITLASVRSWRRGSPESLILLSACFLGVLEGQWGQATTLGAAVIGAGLVLASATEDETVEEEVAA